MRNDIQSITVSLALLAACSDNGRPAANPAAGGTAGEAGAVRCTLFYRASNEVTDDTEPGDLEFEEQVLELGPGEQGSANLAGVTLSLSYNLSEQEPDTLLLEVTAGETALLRTLYQLIDQKLPQNQFAGGHGFTGLMYFTHPSQGGDYQAICESRG